MATLTIVVAGVDRTEYLCAPGAGEAATFEEALRERKTFSCEFLAREGLWSPLRGQGITVTHSTEGVIFGGYLTNPVRHVASVRSSTGAIANRCTCVGYEQIMSRRLAIVRTWTGQVAGGIFFEIVDESLTGEGFTVEMDTGPTIPLFSIQEPRPTVRDALDRLCELASTSTDTYYWDVSPTKVARFFRQDTYPAPFGITDANPYVLESPTPASVDETSQGLINRVFVYLGQFLLEEAVETFLGDGSATIFELLKPCGETPTITLDLGAGPVAQTVGIAGSDIGKEWYWTLGSNQIQQGESGYLAWSTTSLLIAIGSKSFTTQAGLAYVSGVRVRASYVSDSAKYMEGSVTSYSGTSLVVNVDTIGGSGTFADWELNLAVLRAGTLSPVVPADTLSVTYRGLDRRTVGPFEDAAAYAAEGALQGNGTGLYETSLQLESVGTSSDAETLAQAWLERNKRATMTFRGATYVAGLRSGQEITVNLTTLGINAVFLIQSVTMTDAGAGRFLWTFQAIFGAARDDWKRALLGQTASTSISGSGGGGAVGPEGPPGASGTGVAAPNVTATANVFYESWANSQRFGFSGVITLPTGHADYAELDRIDVMAIGPDDTSYLVASFTAWAGTTIAYSATVDEQPAANESWDLEFVVYNPSGAPSPSPYTLTGLTVSAAGLTSVSAAEVSADVYQDQNQGLHTVVAVTPVAGTLPLVVTLWLDFDDGAGWIWQGWWRLTTGGQVIRIGDPAESTEGAPGAGTIWVPSNPDNTSWKVAAAAGAIFKTSTPPAGYVQSGFTVAAVAAALATDITNAAFVADPVTSNVIVYTPTSLGGRTWHFYELRWEQPSLDAAPHYWHSVLTVQKGAIISGTWTPAPDYEGQDSHAGLYLGRRVTDASAAQGGDPSLSTTAIVRGDKWEDWTYPPNNNDDGTPNLYRTFRFRIYSVSRRGADADGATGVIILNTCWAGGADYYDLTPGAQPNTLDLSVTNPATLAAPLSMVLGKVGMANKAITAQFMGDASVGALQMAANAITAANGALAANAVVDANVLEVGVTKLIHGTRIFTGDVVFSRGSTKPVLSLKNSGMFLYGVADGPGTAGLTSQPHVVIQSTGIGVLSSQTGPSVTISGSGVAVWSVNGSITNPYAVIGAAAIQLVNGSFVLDVTASQIKLQYIAGVSLTLNAAQLQIVNGSYSLTATATSLALVGGSSSVTITTSAVTIVNGVLTTPVIAIIDGSTTVNIDATNHIKVSSSATPRSATHTWSHFRVENSSGGFSQLELGACTVTDNSGVGRGILNATNVNIGGNQIIGTRKTDPGVPSFVTLLDAQNWCANLRNQLVASTGHGLF